MNRTRSPVPMVTTLAAVLCALSLAVPAGCGGGSDADSTVGESGAGVVAAAPVRAHEGPPRAPVRWEADTDRDGIGDLDEIRDGTDPADPSDAMAWHPEWSGHPRLLFDTDDLDWVRARCLSRDEPYATLFASARSIANRQPPDNGEDAYSPSAAEVRGAIAKLAAFVAVVEDDPAWAAKAVTLLLEIRDDVHTLRELDQATIHSSQALVDYSFAYDWLAGFGYLEEPTRSIARKRIHALSSSLEHFYQYAMPLVVMGAANNHKIKFASGLGVAGMLLNDLPEAARWVNYAMTSVDQILLDFQNCPGGCQAEGTNYLTYSMRTYWPFFAAYHRFANGAAYPYMQRCHETLLIPCEEEVRDVDDFWTSDRVREVHQWWLDLRMPGGRGPDFDDASLHCSYTGLMAASMASAEANDVFRNSRDCAIQPRDSLIPETIVTHDPDLEAVPAEGSAMRFLSEAGNAVLRSGWDDDARYLLLLGEHGNARTHGIGHEQPDATSFLFAAYGEYLLIDSGYPGWGDRDKTAEADNHSLILVDGEGPPAGVFGVGAGVDAYLSDPVDDGTLQAATVETKYAGAVVTRRAVLVDGRYAATFDRVEAAGDRDFTFLLHTNGGGSSGGSFSRLADGCLVERSGVDLRAAVASTRPVVYADHLDIHGISHTEYEHAVLTATATGTAPAFVGVYLPGDASQPVPSHSVAGSDGAGVAVVVDGDSWTDLLLVTEGDLVRFDESDTGLPDVLADAEGAFLRFAADTLELEYSRVFGAGSVEIAR